MLRMTWLVLLAAAALQSVPDRATAQTYPNGTIKILVGFPPGGTTDIIARDVGQELEKAWHQTVIVENRAGANGAIAAAQLAKLPPDGQTLMMIVSGHITNPLVSPSAGYDAIKDFTAISLLASSPLLIFAHPSFAANDIKGAIALAKEKPGTYNFGSSGPGSSLHLFAEMFNSIEGIKLVHIPYRGDAPMITALISNDIQLAFLPQANGIANVQSNLIRGLGVTGTKRMEAIPNVPTAQEQGIKGLEVGSWVALFAPAGTPPDIVQAIQRHLADALSDPKVREWLISTGQNPVGNPPAEFSAQFKADIERFAKVIDQAKIPKLD